MNNHAGAATVKTSNSKLLIFGLYSGIIFAFICVRVLIISKARDPYLWSYALPTSTSFQISLGLLALLAGIASLFAIGVIVQKGNAKEMLYTLFALPLILFLLELVTQDF